MEYGEMMRQFGRFCAAQAEMAEDAGMNFQCDGCKLEKNSVCENLPDAVKPEDVAEAERVVTRWAEEHPEPVYPTWEQFIAEMYLRYGRTKYHNIAEWKVNEPIPADIAQKHWIEPKEG